MAKRTCENIPLGKLNYIEFYDFDERETITRIFTNISAAEVERRFDKFKDAASEQGEGYGIDDFLETLRDKKGTCVSVYNSSDHTIPY